MSATLPAAPRNIDRDRVNALMERERARLLERTAKSGEYYERAKAVMPGGVPSQFQKNDPWPTYLTRGSGSQVWDVDGNQYTDFHNGFGVMCVGHANPIDRRRREGADGRGHALRRANRGLDHRRRGAAPPLGPPALALHELRHRVHDGRRSTSRAGSPAATSSSRSRAPTTAITTP